MKVLASGQLSLSDPDVNAVGKSQRPGAAAQTQRIAAVMAYPHTGTARRKVLDCIGYSSTGLTDEEIQQRTALSSSTQRPRRVELVEGGWVEDSGERRATRSGRDAVVWVLTERGYREWRS